MNYPKSLSKIVSKSSVRKELSMIQLKDGKMRATDSFKAFERDVDVKWDCLVYPSDLKAKDTLVEDEYGAAQVIRAGRSIQIATEPNEKYPNLDEIINSKMSAEKVGSIKLSVKYLTELLSAFSEENVTLSIIEKGGISITLEGKKERGVLMGILA